MRTILSLAMATFGWAVGYAILLIWLDADRAGWAATTGVAIAASAKLVRKEIDDALRNK